eukprot:1254217-Prymnesium_polylepis.1
MTLVGWGGCATLDAQAAVCMFDVPNDNLTLRDIDMSHCFASASCCAASASFASVSVAIALVSSLRSFCFCA